MQAEAFFILVEMNQERKAVVSELERRSLLLLGSVKKMLEMIFRFCRSFGSEVLLKCLFESKYHEDRKVFETFNARGTSFWSGPQTTTTCHEFNPDFSS